MRLKSAVERFLAVKRDLRGLSPRTLKLYRHYLARFLGHLGRGGPSSRAVEGFFTDLRTGDHARLSAFSILRNFFRWSVQRRLLAADPTQDMAPPIVRQRARRSLTLPELDRLLAAVLAERAGRRRPTGGHPGGSHARRDHALIACLFWAALRIGEAVRLRPEDLDFQAGEVRVEGKGGRVRVLPMHERLRPILRDWLRRRAAEAAMLFPSRNASGGTWGRLDGCQIDRMIREVYAPAAGLRGVTPHALRRGFAKRLLDKGTPVPVIQNILGHAKMETTLIYVQAAPQDLRRYMLRA